MTTTFLINKTLNTELKQSKGESFSLNEHFFQYNPCCQHANRNEPEGWIRTKVEFITSAHTCHRDISFAHPDWIAEAEAYIEKSNKNKLDSHVEPW